MCQSTMNKLDNPTMAILFFCCFSPMFLAVYSASVVDMLVGG